MGVAISRSTDLAQNEYLLRFVSEEYISPNDPFWNRFLSFNITPPRSRYVKVIYEIIQDSFKFTVTNSWR